MTTEFPDTRALLQAKLTLLALRAGLPDSNQVPRESGAVVRPADHVLSEMDAARVLAGMPKPLTCTGDAGEATLVVTCEPVTHPDHVFLLGSSLRALAEGEGVFGSIPDERGPVPVLVVGCNESMQVPSDIVKEWVRSYVLVGPNSFGGGQDLTETQRNDGTVYVITVGRAETITPEEFLAALLGNRVAGVKSPCTET